MRVVPIPMAILLVVETAITISLVLIIKSTSMSNSI